MDSNKPSASRHAPGSAPAPRVIVLGSFIVDLAFRSAHMPRAGETIRGERFALGPGGKGSNQAIAAARSGAEVVLISAVGDDLFAALALDTLRGEGISSAHVHRFPGGGTGVAFIHVDPATGENRIIVVPAANDSLDARHIEAAQSEFASAAVFLTQLEQPLGTAVAAFREARKHGVTTIFNPAPAMELDDAVLELCDYITPNESEATLLSGLAVGDDAEVRAAAAELRRRGAKGIVITLGGRGAYLLDDNHDSFFEPFAAGDVVDTTGAGDAFNGAFAAALAAGADARAAVVRGCAAGALCVTRAGTATAMPQAGEIDRLIGGRATGNGPPG